MRVAIGLGSNLDDPRHQLETALTELTTQVGTVVSVSSLYESEAVGGPPQDPFLNAVAVVDTDLAPLQLLEKLQRLERLHHRRRQVRWGPRTLDLDIIARGDGPFRAPGLDIPHIRAHQRRFVLDPLREVWPEVVLADGREAAVERDLPEQAISVLKRDWWSLPPT